MYRFFSALGSDALVEILKQSSDATAIYSGEKLKIQLVNDTMLAVWGKDQSVHGKTFDEALPEMKDQPFTELLKNVWRTGNIFKAEEMLTININGSLVTSYFDFIYKPIFNAQGDIYYILHTAINVTQRVLVWRTVGEKEKREQQINGNLTGGIGTFTVITTRKMIMQGKDDFISIASHKLKTPVKSLKASLQLLQRSQYRLPIETRNKLLNQSITSLEKLSSLITGLLNTSRIEQGQMKIDKQNFTLSELFDECCTEIIKIQSKRSYLKEMHLN